MRPPSPPTSNVERFERRVLHAAATNADVAPSFYLSFVAESLLRAIPSSPRQKPNPLCSPSPPPLPPPHLSLLGIRPPRFSHPLLFFKNGSLVLPRCDLSHKQDTHRGVTDRSLAKEVGISPGLRCVGVMTAGDFFAPESMLGRKRRRGRKPRVLAARSYRVRCVLGVRCSCMYTLFFLADDKNYPVDSWWVASVSCPLDRVIFRSGMLRRSSRSTFEPMSPCPDILPDSTPFLQEALTKLALSAVGCWCC